jgi:hypothetical protein
MTTTPATGWLCPRCNRVNAPTVLCCQCGERDPPKPPPGDQRHASLPHVDCGNAWEPRRLSTGSQDLEHYTTRPPK